MVRRGVISLAMCATLVAIPFVVEAQFPGGGGVGGGTGGSGRGAMTRGHPGETRDATPRAPDAAELLLIQLGELDEDLKLAPDQRKAWNRYFRERAAALRGREPHAQRGALSEG